MSHILLDTHAWAWTLSRDSRLSTRAVTAIEAAETVSVSAISLYEIGQKVRLGKWPEMVPYFPELIDIAERQGAQLLAVSPGASMVASVLDWDHRDPFDRFIGAIALTEQFTLISADSAFDQLDGFPGWSGRVW